MKKKERFALNGVVYLIAGIVTTMGLAMPSISQAEPGYPSYEWSRCSQCTKAKYNFTFNRVPDPNKIKCVREIKAMNINASDYSCKFSFALESVDGGVYAGSYNSSYTCGVRRVDGGNQLAMWFSCPFSLLIGCGMAIEEIAGSGSSQSKARNVIINDCKTAMEELEAMACPGMKVEDSEFKSYEGSSTGISESENLQ